MDTYTFEAQSYRSRYLDMANLSDAEARDHFLTFGVAEGRIGAHGGIREEFLPRVPRTGPVLEIGPFAGPSLSGPYVRYADVLSREGLRARAIANDIDPDGCPEIHYVLTDLDLDRIPDRFEAVFSSHCLEHQTDLVRHLQAVERLLADRGRYFLIVPDKRFCFDHFLPATSIADVMTAYVRQHRVHEIGSVIEHWALTTHNETERHWQGDHGQARIAHSTEMLVRAVQTYDSSHYIDVHAWQFTPLSLMEIVRLLGHLRLTTFRCVELHTTARNRNEFCAILRKAESWDAE